MGRQSLTLQAALYRALTSNPDLATLRQGALSGPSPEAVEVARHFPVTLNPTLWVDYRPITLIPPDTFGNQSPGGGGPGTRAGTRPGSRHGGFYHYGQDYLYLSLRQPMELGHQTTHRYEMARAALDQQRWIVTQTELTALVQTYRLFQTAAYCREKLRVARDLADFNDQLVESLRGRQEANQATAADVVLARVENRAARQQARAAQQDYLTALTDLRNQSGVPEAAGRAEPMGEFTLPATIPDLDEQAVIQTALMCRPEIHAARAQVGVAQAAVRLAKGDRIPSPVLGPEWEIDEADVQYVGFVYIQPLPILNTGKPLVHQREADARRACIRLQQAQQRAVSQVRSAVAKWNGATELVRETGELTREQLTPGGGYAGAAVRGWAGGPDQADAGPATADPAIECSAGCHPACNVGAGRPAAGPGRTRPDPGHVPAGRGGGRARALRTVPARGPRRRPADDSGVSPPSRTAPAPAR